MQRARPRASRSSRGPDATFTTHTHHHSPHQPFHVTDPLLSCYVQLRPNTTGDAKININEYLTVSFLPRSTQPRLVQVTSLGVFWRNIILISPEVRLDSVLSHGEGNARLTPRVT